MKPKWKWKSLSHVWLFATPWTIQSMEFSTLEYWSGYPFPSPGDLPNPGIEPRSPALRVDSLPAALPGKPKKTGVGSLSLLQQIFLAHESNWGLLHCRWILYQLRSNSKFYINVLYLVDSHFYVSVVWIKFDWIKDGIKEYIFELNI